MNFQQVQQFLGNFNLHADKTTIIIPTRKYQLVILTAAQWYGAACAVFISDCFMDTHDARHLFMPSSWEELQQLFEESTVPLLSFFQKSR